MMIHDRNAERAVLAACLTSAPARKKARRQITGADFWEPAHETIWEAMSRLDKDGKHVDPVTLLAAVKSNAAAVEMMPDLVTTMAMPDTVTEHAEMVRSWAIKRRIQNAATQIHQQALSPDLNAVGFAATAATTFADIRDSGLTDNTTAEMLGELLAEEDDEPDWLIPGLLERRDRFMLTGEEGLGKSHLLRQIAVCAAAGLHPFEYNRIKPLKVTLIDCENSRSQVKRKIRGITEYTKYHGLDPSGRVLVECSRRVDITKDKDLAKIHNLLDSQHPDLVVIGPLYRLIPRAIQSDDDAAPLLAALDTIRDRGIALLIEAHAGHAIGKGGFRDLRPRGSSALLGWPEFGYGMRSNKGVVDLVPWRGDRDERSFPSRLRHAKDGIRWTDVETELKPWGAA